MIKIINADSKDALRDLIAQGVQVDAIVTDPPYELGFMGKEWDKTGIANDVELWKLCLEVLKPGGHLLSFGGARTYHRMACAIEDAGFEVRDQVMWIFGQGFPKSLDISKAIDKAAGAEREKKIYEAKKVGNFKNRDDTRPWIEEAKEKGYHEVAGDEPVTELAKQWQGWGTALKPAHEPIVLARKPLSEKTIAANVVKFGTGAINIDGCRVATTDNWNPSTRMPNESIGTFKTNERTTAQHNLGRFPANLIHDGSEEVEAEFAKFGNMRGGFGTNTGKPKNAYGKYRGLNGEIIGYGDNGTASRFFYCAKASKNERNGSKHPTVKPLALMRYLCRLITPPGGTVLDPFAGTGTTGQAADAEGFNAILIEREQEYVQDIYRRIELRERQTDAFKEL